MLQQSFISSIKFLMHVFVTLPDSWMDKKKNLLLFKQFRKIGRRMSFFYCSGSTTIYCSLEFKRFRRKNFNLPVKIKVKTMSAVSKPTHFARGQNSAKCLARSASMKKQNNRFLRIFQSTAGSCRLRYCTHIT